MCYHVYDTLGDPCYLYLIECDGFYKIGRTDDLPYLRLAALQTGSPHLMELVSFFRGATKLERLMHHMFRELRARGEWFVKDDSIRAQFQSFAENNCELCEAA